MATLPCEAQCGAVQLFPLAPFLPLRHVVFDHLLPTISRNHKAEAAVWELVVTAQGMMTADRVERPFRFRGLGLAATYLVSCRTVQRTYSRC